MKADQIEAKSTFVYVDSMEELPHERLWSHFASFFSPEKGIRLRGIPFALAYFIVYSEVFLKAFL